MLDKLHETLIAKNTNYFMKEKAIEIHFHFFVAIYILLIWIRMLFFCEQWEEMMCFHVSQLLIISNFLL